jgi:molybdate transport system substrate-binding protein
MFARDASFNCISGIGVIQIDLNQLVAFGNGEYYGCMSPWVAAITTAVLLLWGGYGPAVSAQERRALTVAAASDLQAALPEIIRTFERETRATVTVSFGSSGNFFAQIQNGAPFDVFLSADIDYPRQLAASGRADGASLYQYATGRIVLWTRKDSGIDVTKGLRGLTDSRIGRIAIANPKHAPYGRAAEAALRYEKVYDAVRPRLVLGENISQTAQLVDSGNASVGIIALSLAVSPALRATGTYTEVPLTAHPPIQQAAVVVSASRNKGLARELVAYLGRPDVRQLLQRFGFMPPQPVSR